MAEIDNKVLLEVEVGNSAKTIAELKKELQELRKSLDSSVAGSKEAEQQAEALAKKQNELRQAIKGNTEIVEQGEKSYNALVQQMGKLRETWKNTTDEAKKKELTKQIASINEELKKQDASIGNYQRNVGDYANKIKEAFGAVGAGSTKMATALGSVGKASTALSVNPLFAILGVAVLAVKKLYEAFKNNEEAVKKLNVVFAPFQGVLNAVNTAIGKLVNLIADGLVNAFDSVLSTGQKFFNWLADSAEKVGLTTLATNLRKVNQRMEEAVTIANEENELLTKQRNIEKEISEIEVRKSQLEAEFAKNAGNAVKQAEIAKKIEEENQKAKQKQVDLAQAEYDLIVKKNAQAPNSTADYKAENDALIKLNNAKRDLNQLTAESKKVYKQQSKDIAESNKELQKLTDELQKWKEEQTTTELQRLESKYKKEQELLKDNQEALKTLEEKYNEDKKAIEAKRAKEKIDSALKGGSDNGATNELMVEFNLRKAQHELTLNEEEEYNRRLYEIQSQQLLDKKAKLEEEIADKENFNLLTAEQQQVYLDNLTKLNEEIVLKDSQRTLQEAEESKKRQNQAEQERQFKVQASIQTFNAIGNLMNSFANTMDETNKEQFEAKKAMEIGTATISMISGIVEALSGKFTTHSGIWDIAIAATQATAIGVAGAANIAKIAKTKFGDKTTPNTANTANISTTATRAMQQPVQYTQEVNSSKIEESIKDNKVYVTETDISNTVKKVSVQETENTY